MARRSVEFDEDGGQSALIQTDFRRGSMASEADFLKNTIATLERALGPDALIVKRFRAQLSRLESIKKGEEY
jgi:hypothetical protein